MPSRMEKYYGHSSKKPKEHMRSNRNQELYNKVYSYGDYSNIEGIAELEKAGQVEMSKVKELLDSQNKIQNKREYRTKLPEKEEITFNRKPIKEDERNYDIRDILKEAKSHQIPDNKERVLKNKEYNILKNIDLKKSLKREDYFKSEPDRDLKEMIDNITNTSRINKLGNIESAEDLLSDLKADDTKVGELDSIKDAIEKEKNDVPLYDKSFFTSSLKLNKSDFVDNEKPKSNALNIVIIIILIILIAISSAVLIMNYIK